MSKEDRKVEVPFEEALAEIMSKAEGEGETERDRDREGGERERDRERDREREWWRWSTLDGTVMASAIL
jgi:hypothetical protein